jgi:hypothetical protein
LSNYVGKSQITGLEHLTDDQLLQYHDMVNALSKYGTRHSKIHLAHTDTKKLYHLVRLLLEVEQILVHQDLDLECNGAILRSIRNGEWSLQKIEEWFTEKEKVLEDVYHKSTLQYSPNESIIKKVLLETLEMHYGTISNAISIDVNQNIINDIQQIINKYSS